MIFKKKLSAEQIAQLPKITVYTRPTCIYCHALLDWLDNKGIPYTEKPAGEDITSVPTTKIKDATIVGFDRPAIKKALGLKKF